MSRKYTFSEIPEYTGFCPSKLSLETLNENFFPTVQRFFDTPKRIMKITVYEQTDILVGMSIYDNVWSLCTKDILMIDFDIKEGFTREKAFEAVRKYTEYMEKYDIKLAFQMYHTDRGVHAFLVSHRIPSDSSEGFRIMMDLCNDPYYIAFSRVSGYCIRIGPKVKTQLSEDQTLQEFVNTEFIAKPAASEDPSISTNTAVIIGTGQPLEYNQKILKVHENLIQWFLRQYRTRLNELTSEKYITETDTFGMSPSSEFFEDVNTYVRLQLEEYGLTGLAGQTFTLYFTPTKRLYTEHSLLIYNQEDLSLQYDLYYGIWRMCTNGLLKIDLDVKPGFTKLDAVEIIRQYTQTEEGKDKLFWIYESDRGVHAFIMNEYIHFRDEKARNIITKLSNDPEFILLTSYSNHCLRIGPKIYTGPNSLKVKSDILSEFVTKKCLGQICEIGTGKVLPYFKYVLELSGEMITFILRLYHERFDEMINRKYFSQINDFTYGPSDTIINEIRDKFIYSVIQLGINKRDITYFLRNSEKYIVDSSRYTNLISNNLIKSCGTQSFEGVINLAMNYVKPSLLERCMKHVFILRGPEYPFVFGQDGRTYMLYLAFYNLCMIDFDVKDGIPKDNVPLVLTRLLNGQRLLPENERLSKSPLCFKLYETDNGVHAFVVSHRIDFNSPGAIRILLETCSDIWYTAFTFINGFNIRLTPKVIDTKNLKEISESKVKSEFIQKLGIKINNQNIIYIGDVNSIDPQLDEMTDVIYKIQKFILKQPFLRKRMLTRDPILIYEVTQKLKSLIKEQKYPETDKRAYNWAQVAQTCSYLENIETYL